MAADVIKRRAIVKFKSDLKAAVLQNDTPGYHLEWVEKNGKTFEIKVKNASDKNIYIQKMILNGKTQSSLFISYNDISNGGTLEFIMSNKHK